MDEKPSDENPAEGPATLRFCPNCEEDVDPKGKGLCPKCGRFLPGNVVSLKHGARRLSLPPERASRRAALRAKVWEALGGNPPPIIAEVAEDFVSACVLRDQLTDYLEGIGPLTERGTRRAAMDLYLATSARIERLSAQLRGWIADNPALAKPREAPGLKLMPTWALERSLGLWERVAAGEALSEREQGELDILDRALRGDILLPSPPEANRQPASPTAAVPAPVAVVPVPVPVPVPVLEQPARKPRADVEPEPKPAPEPPAIDWNEVPSSPETSRLLDLIRRFREGLR